MVGGCATAGAASGFAPAGSLNSTPCLSSPAIRSDFRSHNIRCSFCTFSSSTRFSASSWPTRATHCPRSRSSSSELGAESADMVFTTATVSPETAAARADHGIRYYTTKTTYVIALQQLRLSSAP